MSPSPLHPVTPSPRHSFTPSIQITSIAISQIRKIKLNVCVCVSQRHKAWWDGQLEGGVQAPPPRPAWDHGGAVLQRAQRKRRFTWSSSVVAAPRRCTSEPRSSAVTDVRLCHPGRQPLTPSGRPPAWPRPQASAARRRAPPSGFFADSVSAFCLVFVLFFFNADLIIFWSPEGAKVD